MHLCKDDKGFANIVPMILAIVIAFALLFIGTYINGELSDQLQGGYPASHDRSKIQNSSLSTMNNTSINYDAALDIVQVVIIITVLAAAIGAIFLFTRFR